MDKVLIKVQNTPNPNARKFIVSAEVKSSGKITFKTVEECMHVELACELFLLTNVTQIHFFENVITVTQNGLTDWDRLTENAKEVIQNFLPTHDPDFYSAEEERRKTLSPELQEIESILDRFIRPALRMDGGDLEVIEFQDQIVTIRYEGACGSCPSAELGTLESIRMTLKEEFDPSIEVVTL